MSKSCLDCANCKVRIEVIPLSRGYRKFRHNNSVISDKLNGRFVYRDVRCAKHMWIKNNGEEFIYKNYSRMMREAALNKPESRLKCATNCLRFEV